MMTLSYHLETLKGLLLHFKRISLNHDHFRNLENGVSREIQIQSLSSFVDPNRYVRFQENWMW